MSISAHEGKMVLKYLVITQKNSDGLINLTSMGKFELQNVWLKMTIQWWFQLRQASKLNWLKQPGMVNMTVEIEY